MPAKLLTLVSVIREVADDPWVRLMLFGLVLITKSGVVVVLKVAVCTVSETGIFPPLAISTQVVVPDTLEFAELQPV